MSDEGTASPASSPHAQGQVLKAVAKTWPGFIAGAVEGRAHELIEDGRYGEAAAVVEEGMERFGPETVSQLLLAWCLYMAERYDEAIGWADRAAEEEPENADAHWLRASLLLELERRDEAVEALWAAVDLSPDDGRYYMQLAWTRHEDESFAVTRGLIEQALERAPEDVWVQYTAGRIFEHHLRHRRAQVQYERVLELEPGHVSARCDLAEVLQSRGRLSAGVRVAWETADLEDDESDPRAVYEAVLRRWSWRWFEWALRVALVLNVIDWIFPTPGLVGEVLAGAVVVGFAVGWVRAFSVLPKACRADVVGRRGHFAASALLSAVVLAGIAAVLVGEPSGLQHLGVLGALVGGYVLWIWRATGISGRAMFGGE
ncbi:tetratricopeptide repeat protein [Glycomyces sp. NPDC046736]|uniref:tetratricopeptide repeat protein n=1 Tax=Glycomyces sp. NPDC046736 TaxID=3155615 RepID=UPI0033DA3766